MESSLLEFECVGIEDGGKIPVENTGRVPGMAFTGMQSRNRPKVKSI